MSKKKRLNNWWEPIYFPDAPDFKKHNWEFKHSDSAKHCVFLACNLPSQGDFHRYEGKRFDCCDFEGDFAAKLNNQNIKFTNCVFIKCDFGESFWKNASFRNCQFMKTSFTLSTFVECEFRNCYFEDIAYSGNRTSIPGTLITNPSQFLNAASAFLNHLPDNVSGSYQKTKLIETKSNMSRVLLSNVMSEGSEATYYEAVRASTLLAAQARHVPLIMKVYGEKRKIKACDLGFKNYLMLFASALFFCSGLVESLLLRFLGTMNAWGGSIFRTLVIGAFLLIIFSAINVYFFQKSCFDGFVRSFEVFFLFGYTNYTPKDLPQFERIFLMLNAFLGILWYVINVPTIVNKLTRIRG